MSNFYIISTINNLKNLNLLKKEKDYFFIKYDGKKIFLHKGEYIVMSSISPSIKIMAVITKEFFKENFEIIGRSYLKFTKNINEEVKLIGLLCQIKEGNND